MKLKHNKKRNTAFLFECLIKELAKATLYKDSNKKNIIINIIKEHFAPGTTLGAELKIYKTLSETKNLDAYTAEKIVIESKKEYAKLNQKTIFNDQTSLIDSINKKLSPSVMNNFVPNYKNLASINQIFNSSVPIKTRVLLENKLLQFMIGKEEKKQEMTPVDNLVFKSFIKKFNEKYKDDLLENQKNLISLYVTSMDGEESASFKMQVAEEIDNIKNAVNKFIYLNPNHEEKERLTEVINLVETFKRKSLDKEDLKIVLKMQRLCEDLKNGI